MADDKEDEVQSTENDDAEVNTDAGAESEQGGDENFVPDEIAAAPEQAAADINLDLVMEVPVKLALQVGKTNICIRDLVSLVEGSVVELDRPSTDPMDVLVNDTLVARGEIVVVDDKFGVRLTDVVNPSERVQTLNQ
ncbi:MAG: flagellar motor switch protein FliN [Pseudomonadota bacterium]